MRRTLTLFLAAALAGCGGQKPGRTELVVSSAASLSDAMTALSAAYHEAHPDVLVRNNFGGSGTLEQQIRHGAGVDVFLSAADEQMDELERAGLIEPATRRELLRNALVLAVPTANPAEVSSFADLAAERVGRVAMGAPASVPAGAYAEATLQALGLWSAVKPKAVLTSDVRQALAYVERGEADAALVYRTDAMRSSRVRVVTTAPPSTHRPIVYPAAVVADSRHPEAARAYLRYLSSPAAAAVFRRYGFEPATGD